MRTNSVHQDQRKSVKGTSFFRTCGGRKQLNGYLAAGLITFMAHSLNAPFHDYAFAVIASLGLTSGLVAWEDRIAKSKVSDELMGIQVTTVEQNGAKSEVEILEHAQGMYGSVNNL